MNPLRSQFAQLAYQVDRRILDSDEEDYFRLDLSAHECGILPALPQTATQSFVVPKLHWLKDYSFMALALFAVMFMVSNLPAYAKLSMANLSEAQNLHLQSMEVTRGVLLAEDHWTGEKTGAVLPSLQAKELAMIRPDDGILPIAPVPSSMEDRISIPSIEVNAPLVEPNLGLKAVESKDWNELEDQIRSSLLQGVVHYPGTADPGKKGNFFVTGHSSNVFWEQSAFNTVFARLPKIEVGSEIIVTKDQREYVYVVTEKKEVSPKDVSVLTQGGDTKMTLMTCTPVGTTLNRLVVTAVLKD